MLHPTLLVLPGLLATCLAAARYEELIEVRLEPEEKRTFEYTSYFSQPGITFEYDVSTEGEGVKLTAQCNILLPCQKSAYVYVTDASGSQLGYDCCASEEFKQTATFHSRGSMRILMNSGRGYRGRYSCTVSAGRGPTRPPTTTQPPTTTPTLPTTTTEPPPVIPPGECPCGRRFTERIVNGDPALKGEFPWQVSLQQPAGAGWAHYCGGSLVSPRFALTAAHCLNNEEFDVVAHVGSISPYQGGTRLPLVRIWRHEGFQRDTLSNDVTLMEFRESVPLSGSVFPVCLPQALAGETFAGRTMEASGFGSIYTLGPYSSALMKTSLVGISNKACVDDYEYEPFRIDGGMLCALNKDTDTCKGDSGGPLVYTAPGGTVYLAGIVSWGHLCANPLYPGVFTRVTKFQDWIEYKSQGAICSR